MSGQVCTSCADLQIRAQKGKTARRRGQPKTAYNSASPKFTPLRSVNFGRVPRPVVRNAARLNEIKIGGGKQEIKRLNEEKNYFNIN